MGPWISIRHIYRAEYHKETANHYSQRCFKFSISHQYIYSPNPRFARTFIASTTIKKTRETHRERERETKKETDCVCVARFFSLPLFPACSSLSQNLKSSHFQKLTPGNLQLCFDCSCSVIPFLSVSLDAFCLLWFCCLYAFSPLWTIWVLCVCVFGYSVCFFGYYIILCFCSGIFVCISRTVLLLGLLVYPSNWS